MEKGRFVSYEKTTEAIVTRIKHIVRIQLNSTPSEIRGILKDIPDSAKVSMIVDDTEEDGTYGEIIFQEEKISD